MHAVVFETLTTRDRWRVAWHRLWGRAVFAKSVEPRAREKSWLRRRLEGGSVRPLIVQPPLYRWQDDSARSAFRDVETVFGPFAGEKSIRRVLGLYQDPVVADAFRKALATELTDSHYQVGLAHAVTKAAAAARVTFYPEDPLGALHGLRARSWGLRPQLPPGFRYAARARRAARKAERRRRATALGMLAHLRWRSLRDRATPVAGRARLAITIVSPKREFANEVRTPDFIVDGQILKPADVVFAPLQDLAADQLQLLRDRGYACASRWAGTRRTYTRRRRSVGRALMLRSLWRPSWISLTAAQLLQQLVLWEAFQQRSAVKKFLTYADSGVPHIGRNSVLRRSGVRTFYYVDAGNFGDLTRPGAPPLHPFWGYLHYDHLVVWNQRLRDYFQLHPNRIGAFDTVGCLWSQLIEELRSGRRPSDFPRRLERAGRQARHRVVGVFDSWYTRDGINTREDLLAFIHGIQRLLDDEPDVFVVYKEKVPRDSFPKEFYEDARAIYDAYERLRNQPRCLLLGPASSPWEVAAFSDLVISFPFTSISYEALGARRRALYFDPADKFRNTRLDKVPGFVAHGYDELLTRTRALLTMGERDYQSYLDRHVKGTHEPYLDAHAIDRLRALLIA